ncbi:hypothetical protein EW146_g6024 [Bondarzewia mesenterica]|uniref:Rhodanese domain-containing protein n=1 Tax=Bondarzewia mesenterica TaxID=1095465 RepID=A0A4S4LPS3_9AGAM|nr:hypothetical protein EW146_g6024 [Bondarzewia mesenterica]
MATISPTDEQSRLSESPKEQPLASPADPRKKELPPTPTLTKSRSSVTSTTSISIPAPPVDTSLSPFHNAFHVYHREEVSDSSITTPVFSLRGDTPILRTLDEVRDQVAEKIAVRALRKVKVVDDVKVAVVLTFSKKDDAKFLQQVAGHLQRILALKEHLVAIATTGVGPSSLIICGSSAVQVQRAALLASSKFIGRIQPVLDEGTHWIARIHEIGWTAYDEAALWDAMQKSAQRLVDPLLPPPGSRSIAQVLEAARARLQRLSPQQAYEELHDASIPMPVLLVDIRPQAQREEHGAIRGSLVIERNVLEWRFDPRCTDGKLEVANRYDLRVIVFCQEGYTSSLAAAALQDLGLLNVTDVVGGYKAWRDAGLPVEIEPIWVAVPKS